MTTQRCIELFHDAELQDYIHAECRRHSHDCELQADFRASAWAAITDKAADDCDLEVLKRLASNAIRSAYKAELRRRKMMRELATLYKLEDYAQPFHDSPSRRRIDAGFIPGVAR